MTDLAILVPSRGRPESVARLAEACAKRSRTDYVLHFGFDDDDASLDANRAAAAGSEWTVLPRMGLSPWTNFLAEKHHSAAFLASLGDDHLPQTDGWDEQLITAVEHTGGGFAYPNDWRRIDIPEAVVTTRRIVDALGWFSCPLMDHWCIDDVWADLGRGAQCLTFCKDVNVRHLNPGVVSGVLIDATYGDAAKWWDADQNAYKRWRLKHMTKDIATVRSCLNRPS